MNMKKIWVAILVLAAIILGTTLSACRGSGPAGGSVGEAISALSPAKVIEAFYQACKTRSYDLAKGYLSASSIEYFNSQEQRDPNKGFHAFVDYCATNLNAPEFSSVRTENERITNNSAVVDAAFVFRNNEPEFIPHRLVRDDSWHIDMVSTLDSVSVDQPHDGYRKELERSGRWLRHPKYGEVWRPTEVGYNWQPYCQDGRFVRAQNGWTWNSEREWGERVFHYGRWTDAGPLGWVWVPGDQYAPAWVTWRSNERYVGWAPLGPNIPIADYSSSQPYTPPSPAWVFVPARTFVETVNVTETTRRVSYTEVRAPVTEYSTIIQSSTPFFGLRIVKGRVFNEGVDVVYLERTTGIPIRTYTTRTVIVDRSPRPGYYGVGVPPGHGGIPPGHGGVPPGLVGGVPPGHRRVPPGYYAREEAWSKKDFKHAEHEQRKYEHGQEKAERKREKEEEKEWKHGHGHGHHGHDDD